MGLTVYLDSCIVIYIVEENLEFLPIIEKLAGSIPDLSFVVSPLTEMECLVFPMRHKKKDLQRKFGLWFENAIGLSFNRDIFLEAAKLRAEFQSLKTPDAIHIATANHFGIDEFWTNDDRLEKINCPISVRNIVPA